ncbi:hypothetical protein VC83_07319 [Pseudogymnoascus destructans]|uniref:Uncharacterized protein n=1 Tax=Pseudogymnoascus destructans TaxID=655981 RepID=A0A177A6B3_9PEZI|nr:uncharacterized protein VC83_07319 [Pseudogymnoascus destructans]OAF56554.1 hypothetical protein VC83_07319 [Pseudogymnoascus destructans]
MAISNFLNPEEEVEVEEEGEANQEQVLQDLIAEHLGVSQTQDDDEEEGQLEEPVYSIQEARKANAANVVDHAATDAVRDNEKVQFDVQSAGLGRPSVDGILRMLMHMSLMCDPRAPVHIPDEVLAALPPDPIITALELEQEQLKAGAYRIWGTSIEAEERNDLVRRIKNHGYELPEMDSCSNCVRRNVTCVSSPNDSRRCAECVRRNLKEKCDCMGPEHPDWVKLEREEDRLDREEEETLSKLLRLRKQKRLIRTRGKDMLRRGLKTLDELDAAEEAERVAAEKRDAVEAEEQAVSAASSSVTGTPAVILTFVALKNLLLKGVGQYYHMAYLYQLEA